MPVETLVHQMDKGLTIARMSRPPKVSEFGLVPASEKPSLHLVVRSELIFGIIVALSDDQSRLRQQATTIT